METPAARHMRDAQSMGLSSERVEEYVREQLANERDERVQEREAKVKVLQLEKEVLEKKLELANMPERAGTSTGTTGKIPRLPPWQEGENIEAFFLRLDRFSLDYNWSAETKLHQLLSLLSGKALTIYHQLEEAEQASYEELKEALLKAFDLSTEECRVRFRDIRIKPHETAAQFAARIKAYFRKYWRSDGAEETVEGLLDLIYREAFMKSMPQDLVANLNQNKVKTLDEVKAKADAWFDAHGHPSKARSQPKASYQQRQQPSQKLQGVQSSGTQPEKPQTTTPRPSGKDWRCRRCQSNDHWFRRCPRWTPRAAAAGVALGNRDSPANDNPPMIEARSRKKGEAQGNPPQSRVSVGLSGQ